MSLKYQFIHIGCSERLYCMFSIPIFCCEIVNVLDHKSEHIYLFYKPNLLFDFTEIFKDFKKCHKFRNILQ